MRRRTTVRRVLGAVSAAMLLSSCPAAAPSPTDLRHPAPARADRGRTCIDVGETRACFGGRDEGCRAEVCRVERPLPPGPVPSGGWRCDGSGRARTCVPRRSHAGPFECETGCRQRHARRPDTGEWACVDQDGAVVCRRHGEAAGVMTTAPDSGWTCGERRGSGGRLCVDLSPDRPAAEGPWSCRFLTAPGEPVVCEHDPRPRLGDGCVTDDECPEATVCAGGACLPAAAPRAECWQDTDCETGRCRFGTCLESAR